jgi:hypothetical protein
VSTALPVFFANDRYVVIGRVIDYVYRRVDEALNSDERRSPLNDGDSNEAADFHMRSTASITQHRRPPLP